MSVPPLRLGSSFESYISGEVIIHKSAVIAPGVILQAAPNSKIIIGAGVCVGMGSIIQADTGTLEIETGANLGAGFLMVGEGKIGANACIGAATTVFRCSVASGQVIQPGSILAYCDRHSRQIIEAITENPLENQIPASHPTTGNIPEQHDINDDLWGLPDSSPTITQKTSQTDNGSQPSLSQSPASNITPVANQNHSSEDSTQPQTTTETSETPESSLTSTDTLGNHVYGQSSVQRLLITLFPHRQSLNKPSPEDD
ncbi:transferase [Calothrix sp. UHCC 0171]|uniref:transferase n=1 Tax=Calothrix sp. UHCC 0171 TaxID=3110245 RepID=UPI002B220EB6|nr:transferase [Calothrix sp. UHCC 0171]MEA5571588.1 transferase [Calothrix sp. UHCC 0171]